MLNGGRGWLESVVVAIVVVDDWFRQRQQGEVVGARRLRLTDRKMQWPDPVTSHLFPAFHYIRSVALPSKLES